MAKPRVAVMKQGAVRRTVTVLLVYVVVAWVVFLLGGWLRRVLALPPLFGDLLSWGLYGGAGVAALVAWYYPVIATGAAGGADDSEVRGADAVQTSGKDADSATPR